MYFDLAEFGERVHELRIKEKLTQEAMAAQIGISQTHYKHIEQGTKGCSIDILLLLAEEFHVSTDYLLTGIRTKRDEEKERLRRVVDELDQVIRKM